MSKKSEWKPKKGKKKDIFNGSYERDRKGERVFILISLDGKRRVTFESWQGAKKLGWRKLK